MIILNQINESIKKFCDKYRKNIRIFGLLLNMIGVVVLGFQQRLTLWDIGTKAKYPMLNNTGWIFLFFGFSFILITEVSERQK